MPTDAVPGATAAAVRSGVPAITTFTNALSDALPPGPVQVIVYVYPPIVTRVPVDSEPDKARALGTPPTQSPADALQLVAAVEVQVSIDELPDGIVPGSGVIVTVGPVAGPVTPPILGEKSSQPTTPATGPPSPPPHA